MLCRVEVAVVGYEYIRYWGIRALVIGLWDDVKFKMPRKGYLYPLGHY